MSMSFKNHDYGPPVAIIGDDKRKNRELRNGVQAAMDILLSTCTTPTERKLFLAGVRFAMTVIKGEVKQ